MDGFPAWPGGLAAAVFAVALLYASVGHAGATGYIAVMTLAGLAPETIRPTALSLNVIVATIATAQFVRAGHFRPRLFWPLAASSVPMAAIGGAMRLSTQAFEAVLGAVLAVSAARIVAEAFRARAGREAAAGEGAVAVQPRPWLFALGSAVGLLSGLTGVGGGVFLTPVLLGLRVAPVREVAAVTAPFILVNSLAGLTGGLAAGRPIPLTAASLAAAAALGGAVGSHLGAFRLPVRAIRLLMAGVLAFASFKLLSAVVGG